MKKPVKKDLDKGSDMKSGKKEPTNTKKTNKSQHNTPETPMEHDAGNQDGSAGLGGTSGI